MTDYNIDNAKNDIENLQDQNSYDFQEIKRLDRLIKDYDKRVLQAINMNNQINKRIQDDYENFKKSIIDENVSAALDKKIDEMQGDINELFALIKNNGSDSNPLGDEYVQSCTSEYILDKMYPMGQSHEAIPSGLITDTWKYNSRWENQNRPTALAHTCNQSGCPGTGVFSALGCWSNVYRVEGTPFTQNTGVEMKDIKVYGWYNGAWELVQHLPVPNGNFYAESFGGDASKYFADSVKETSTSKTIILREANKIDAMNWNTGQLQTENCMYHPFSDVKYFDTKYEYIYTCIDLRKVKWDENGIDDRDSSHYCSNCGGDWWLSEGLTFHDSWQHNKGVCQPKMIEITNEWRRFSMTTVPENWQYGFPKIESDLDLGNGGSSGSSESIRIVDNLYSTSTTSALSANQGRVIKSSLDNINTRIDNLDLGNGGGVGSGLTTQQLANIAKIPVIQNTVDNLPNNYASKDHNHIEYASSSHKHDASEIDNLPSGGGSGEGVPDYSINDANKVLSVNRDGTLLIWKDVAGSTDTTNKEFIYTSPSKLIKYIPTNSEFGTVGRWFKKNVYNTDYYCTINMGSELLFKVYNTTKVEIHFLKLSTVNHLLPAVVYKKDNDEWTRTVISENTPITITGLDVNREYLIRLKVDDIQEGNLLWTEQAGVIIKNVEIDAGGIQYGVVPSNKRGLFIGDSITAGLSMRGGSQPESGGSSVSYPSICCEKLGVQDFRWAFGMTGITTTGPNSIPNALGYVYKICDNIYDYNNEKPDFIVINLGTNDALQSKDTSLFQSRYLELINILKSKFPRIPIIAMIPFGQYYAEYIRNACVGVNDVFICETDEWNISGAYGVHPDVTSHQTAGNKLADFLLQTLGTKFFEGYNENIEIYKEILEQQQDEIIQNKENILQLTNTVNTLIETVKNLGGNVPAEPVGDTQFRVKLSPYGAYEIASDIEQTENYTIFKTGLFNGFKSELTSPVGTKVVDYATLINTSQQNNCIAVNVEDNNNVLYIKIKSTNASTVSKFTTYITNNEISFIAERNTDTTDKIVLNGDEEITLNNATSNRVSVEYTIINNTTKYNITSAASYLYGCSCYADGFASVSGNQLGNKNVLNMFYYGNNTVIKINVDTSLLRGQTLDDVKNYLIENPLTIYLSLK